jgi:hypothetical protein
MEKKGGIEKHRYGTDGIEKWNGKEKGPIEQHKKPLDPPPKSPAHPRRDK